MDFFGCDATLLTSMGVFYLLAVLVTVRFIFS